MFSGCVHFKTKEDKAKKGLLLKYDRIYNYKLLFVHPTPWHSELWTGTHPYFFSILNQHHVLSCFLQNVFPSANVLHLNIIHRRLCSFLSDFCTLLQNDLKTQLRSNSTTNIDSFIQSSSASVGDKLFEILLLYSLKTGDCVRNKAEQASNVCEEEVVFISELQVRVCLGLSITCEISSRTSPVSQGGTLAVTPTRG